MLGRRALADALAAGLLGLLVFALFGHAFLNYDSFYALLWGSDLAHARTPDFGAPVAPTPHPLVIALGIPLSLTGDAAEDVLVGLGLLGLGALAVGLFRLGQELFGTAVGVLAAAILLTRVPVLSFATRGYVDLSTAALVVWAAVLEVRRPRRGAVVFVLLAAAGLMRPEAWIFAGAYWLWLRAPLRLLPLAAAAPVLWLLTDLLVTGNPLHSLIGTSDLARELGRQTGITSVPEVMPRRLGEILRLPELLAAVAGFGLAFAFMRRRLAAPAAIAALNGIAYTAFAVARLPLLGRYLVPAASMLALFAAVGGLGWLKLAADHPWRPRWRAVGAAALLAIAIFFPLEQVGRLEALRDDIAARDRIQADLRDLAGRPGVAGCRTVQVATHRPVPLLRYWLGLPPGAVRTKSGDCRLVPATEEAARLALLDPNEPARGEAPDVGEVLARNRSWVLGRPRPD